MKSFLSKKLRNRTEIGFLISKEPLNEKEFDPAKTSFKALVTRRNLDKTFFLGNQSLGAFFEEAGYPAVPSPDRSPGNFGFLQIAQKLRNLRTDYKCIA